MSPPIPLIALIWPVIRESLSGMLPPQLGLQPEADARTKASVKTRCPVALATSVSDGVVIVMSMYGQACLPPVGQPVVLPVTGLLFADSPAELKAAIWYVCDVHAASPLTVADVPVTVARTVVPS